MHIKVAFSSLTISTSTSLNLQRLEISLIKQADHLKPERRLQYLACRVLLAELMYKKLGIATLPEIIISDNSRPIFKDKSLPDFNISHSGDKIAVALAGNGKVGLDIEINRSRKNWWALAKYTFSEQECEWLETLSDDQKMAGFWQLWTTRESILKLAGKGVWQMKQININPKENKISADFMPTLYSWSQSTDSFYMAISSDQPIGLIELYNSTDLTLTEAKIIYGAK